MIYAAAFILMAVLVFEIVIVSQSKKALYNAWKREFERELSSAEKVDEIVIRELFETTQSPKSAAEYYLETKELCKQTNLE